MIIIGVTSTKDKVPVADSISTLLQLNKLKVNVIESLDNKISTPKELKEYVKVLKKSETDVLIISLTNDAIEKGLYSNISFDIVVHTLNLKEQNDSECILHENIRNDNTIIKKLNDKGYLVIDIDDDNYMELLQGVNAYLLTYGLNSKATITMSSINDKNNKLSICQQRTIRTFSGKVVEPQEFIINIKNSSTQKIYNVLATVAVGLIFNVNSQIFTKHRF